ncbi:MAG TPA: CoA ester lyase, partial [Anaerolineaceae bacterium]|nr:CoA ester lyase [Anaerolineaceae bacterium]
KAASLAVDSVVLDLEDSVAMVCKNTARETVVKALTEFDFLGSERLVRINSFSSGFAEADLEAVLPAKPDGILLPKTIHAADVQKLSGLLSEVEKSNGWEKHAIVILAIIENALGVINLNEIAQADPRLVALICGGEDLAADINAVRTRVGWELFYARSAIVLHAGAYQLQAIDMITTDFSDPHTLEEEAIHSMEMGFTGKQIIHPNQIEPVQEGFSPDDDEIAYALSLIEKYEENEENGQAAFALDGVMIDLPVIIRAQELLRRARAAGKLL